MNLAKVSQQWDLHKAQQILKWVVYALLFINFLFYIYEDTTRAAYTLTDQSTWTKWLAAFATTIDEAAWFVLLAMFELDTYILDDEEEKAWKVWLVRGVRLLCYSMILHTLYAAVNGVIDLQPTVPVENVSSLCELNERDVSFVANLYYTDVTPETCANLSDASEFFWVRSDPVVTDAQYLALERSMAFVDLLEVLSWLIVIGAIEVMVFLQERDVTKGFALSLATYSKNLLFALLLGIGVYWASWSHWVYLWDEFLWICGFAAIGANLSAWREEIDNPIIETTT
ncbi:MAG: hypothetical protein VYE04_12070 [Pseudomonadota bacterium]|nr:hypothetical protein [Pseudomonadota bacterium]